METTTIPVTYISRAEIMTLLQAALPADADISTIYIESQDHTFFRVASIFDLEGPQTGTLEEVLEYQCVYSNGPVHAFAVEEILAWLAADGRVPRTDFVLV